MPIPQYRAPKDSQPWGLLGAIGKFLSPPGYVPRGPLAQSAREAASAQTAGGFNFGRSAAAAAEAGGGVRTEGSMATLDGDPVQWMDNRWVPFMTEGEMARQEQARIRAQAPSAPVLPASSGVTPIIRGTRDGVTPDRTQSDEYKAQMAQYGALQKAKKFEEAEKLGMEIWKQKYGKTAMAQPGGAVGTYNPLMKGMPGRPAATIVPGQEMPIPGFNTESSFSIGANSVPAPWSTQGAAVSAPYQEAMFKAAEKTTGEGMPPLPTTGDKVTGFLSQFFQK